MIASFRGGPLDGKVLDESLQGSYYVKSDGGKLITYKSEDPYSPDPKDAHYLGTYVSFYELMKAVEADRRG